MGMVIAASPSTLLSSVSPLLAAHRGCGSSSHARGVVAVAFRRRCTEYAQLSSFCQHVRKAAPVVQLPFILPAQGAPLLSARPSNVTSGEAVGSSTACKAHKTSSDVA